MSSAEAGPPDVTILEAGIVGICCALAAQERGLTVTLIDRGAPGQATSFGNAGVVSPWSCVPQCTPGVWKKVPLWLLDPKGPVKLRWRDLGTILPWTARFLRNATPAKVNRIADAMERLMRDNVDTYRRFLAGTGDEDLLVDSYMVAVSRGRARPSPDDPDWRLRLDRGAPVDFIGASELRDLEPDLSPEFHSAVLVKGQARARSPGRVGAVLAEKVAAAGGRFIRADIKALSPCEDGTLRLETSDGPIVARRLVVSAGIWSADLLRPLGIKLPLMAERGYHLEFADPGVSLSHSILDVAGKVIISAMTGGIRTAGTAEFASVDTPPNYARARVLEPLAKRVLPGLNTGSKSEWMGIRPSFPDNLPAIGPIPGLPNVLAAFGHSHYGLGMAPATGRILADLAAEVPPNLDLSPYRPDRFASA